MNLMIWRKFLITREEEESETEGVGSAAAARDILNKETKEEEEEDVAPEQDEATDELADMLQKTRIA